MATATLEQTRSIAVGGEYQILSEVTAATGLDIEVFVYSATTDLYSHMAMIDDMDDYPTTKTVGVAYYRQASATQLFDTPTAADAAALVHSTRINELLYQYNLGAATYDGSTVVTELDGSGI